MNAIVLVASELDLGYVGCYGNEWVQTPNLDRLAAEGIVFDQHIADRVDETEGERAWQTGCYRFSGDKRSDKPPSPEPITLLPVLAEHDVGTFLIRDRRLSPHPARWDDWKQIHLIDSGKAEAAFQDDLSAALIQAFDSLKNRRQWLLKLDLGVLLAPSNIPDEYQDRYGEMELDADDGDDPALSEALEPAEIALAEQQNQYAAAVTYLDALVGQVLHEGGQHGQLQEAVVFVTADHGRKLGEDAVRPPSRRLAHEELCHIPLLLRLPNKEAAGRRIAALTQPIDLLPTLFEVFGVPLPVVHGQSLLPLVRGQKDQIREYACTELATGQATEWALRTPQWAYLLAGSCSADAAAESELYVKPDDRLEVNNVRHLHLGWAERLQLTLQMFIEATRRSGPLQPPRLPDQGSETAQQEEPS
ncbi:MAG TPA: sulfatase-like hydrolase/transferase [Gemmataceae bacterium]|nr:sulfatase-like hydrolase/transferase [Gemmataceae bacterium]